jgi:hypothetical protein
METSKVTLRARQRYHRLSPVFKKSGRVYLLLARSLLNSNPPPFRDFGFSRIIILFRSTAFYPSTSTVPSSINRRFNFSSGLSASAPVFLPQLPSSCFNSRLPALPPVFYFGSGLLLRLRSPCFTSGLQHRLSSSASASTPSTYVTPSILLPTDRAAAVLIPTAFLNRSL